MGRIFAAVFGEEGPPDFSWGIHAHHLFTVALCLLGTTLPDGPMGEGAMCILLGEGGSLWITIALLRPSRANFLMRFYSFLLSRLAGVLVSLHIARQCPPTTRALLMFLVVGLVYDNWKTLSKMRTSLRAKSS